MAQTVTTQAHVPSLAAFLARNHERLDIEWQSYSDYEFNGRKNSYEFEVRRGNKVQPKADHIYLRVKDVPATVPDWVQQLIDEYEKEAQAWHGDVEVVVHYLYAIK